MPEMFGTHHSKMLILFRHDDTAQVIIHTANMISKDWTNMTNGVWKTQLLPLLKDSAPPQSYSSMETGSGPRFKADILSYLRAYNKKRDVCTSMVDKLAKYDFSTVRGALVASVPGKHDANHDAKRTLWGWAALKHAIRHVPVQSGKSEIVVQVSSIATLGPTDSWLKRTLLGSFSPPGKSDIPEPDFKIIFPTPDEIRRSLDGYASGGSIHMKIQSAQQTKQWQYMKPMFCHWANDSEKGISESTYIGNLLRQPKFDSSLGQPGDSKDAGRKRAAPHIKTYIRYNQDGKAIDWALLTSANISKQAWGEATNSAGDMRIASWEIGVLVWPELLAGKGAKMVGTFKNDLPAKDRLEGDMPLVGLRVPYSLPLQKYDNDEVPWVATNPYREPDWLGQTWEG
jgi:tyrosyl-DNA phosphodiesterase 1